MLTYLFTAIFSDGTNIIQTPEDISLIDPRRSAFYDVLKKSEEVPLSIFELQKEGHIIAVNLNNGHFNIGGSEFYPYSRDEPINTPLRLVYFRRHSMECIDGILAEPKIDSYHIGWQTTLETGHNLRQIIEVK